MFKFIPGDYRIGERNGRGELQEEPAAYKTETELNNAIQEYIESTIQSFNHISVDDLDIYIEYVTHYDIKVKTPKYDITIG